MSSKSSDNEAVHLAGLEALPHLVDALSENRRKRLDAILKELWSQTDLSDELDEAIDKIRKQFDARESYRSRECLECGRGSDEIELKQCLYCERFVCADHMHKGFCSQKHYEAYHYERTGSWNPRDW